MSIAIIGITAGLLGLLYAYLSFRISVMRMRLKISLGDGGNTALHQAIRAHSNFIEYVPFTLVLLLAASAFQASAWLVLTGALMLVASRVLHAVGMRPEGAVNPFRRGGAALTYLTVGYASLLCVGYGIWWLGWMA